MSQRPGTAMRRLAHEMGMSLNEWAYRKLGYGRPVVPNIDAGLRDLRAGLDAHLELPPED